MAISMAPGLSQVVVYEAGPQGNGDGMLNRMTTDNSATQLSSSWSFVTDATTDQILRQWAAQGQSFFNASGDTDAYTSDIPSPSDSPYVTVVGGTTLTTSGPSGVWVSETVWNWGGGQGSGGGISTDLQPASLAGQPQHGCQPGLQPPAEHPRCRHGGGQHLRDRRQWQERVRRWRHQLRHAIVGGFYRPGQPAGRRQRQTGRRVP